MNIVENTEKMFTEHGEEVNISGKCIGCSLWSGCSYLSINLNARTNHRRKTHCKGDRNLCFVWVSLCLFLCVWSGCKLFTMGISHVPFHCLLHLSKFTRGAVFLFRVAVFSYKEFPFIESKFSFHVVFTCLLLNVTTRPLNNDLLAKLKSRPNAQYVDALQSQRERHTSKQQLSPFETKASQLICFFVCNPKYIYEKTKRRNG